MRDFGTRTGESRNGSKVWTAGYSMRTPYQTMTPDELTGLGGVSGMAAVDAHLYLWTIQAYVPEAYQVAESWGFRPSALLTWCKAPKGLGLGGAYTSTTEFVLFARKGSLKPLRRWDSTWFQFTRQDVHSAKPDAFLDVVEQVSPGPYLELFARRARFGWDYWGDESLGTVELDTKGPPWGEGGTELDATGRPVVEEGGRQ